MALFIRLHRPSLPVAKIALVAWWHGGRGIAKGMASGVDDSIVWDGCIGEKSEKKEERRWSGISRVWHACGRRIGGAAYAEKQTRISFSYIYIKRHFRVVKTRGALKYIKQAAHRASWKMGSFRSGDVHCIIGCANGASAYLSGLRGV